jgi:hypothetical protein
MQNIHWSPCRKPFPVENIAKKLPDNTGDYRVEADADHRNVPINRIYPSP